MLRLEICCKIIKHLPFYLATDFYHTEIKQCGYLKKMDLRFLIYLVQLIKWSIKNKRAISAEHICSYDEHAI